MDPGASRSVVAVQRYCFLLVVLKLRTRLLVGALCVTAVARATVLLLVLLCVVACSTGEDAESAVEWCVDGSVRVERSYIAGNIRGLHAGG